MSGRTKKLCFDTNTIIDIVTGKYSVAEIDAFIVRSRRNVEQEASRIRRDARPKIKLPDAIVAASAITVNAVLVTRDSDLRSRNWPGLQIVSIK